MRKFIMALIVILFGSFMAVSMAFAAADIWTQKADFGGGVRSGATGFSIGSKGYIGTGLLTDATAKKDFWEYDPAADIWTQKADFGGPARYGAFGFSIGNRGYIGSGFGQNGTVGAGKNDFWEYDPANNTWTRKADFGGALRYTAVAFSIGNKGYVGTGGTPSPPPKRNDFWEYDPATDTWTQKADFGGTARSGAVGFSIGNRGYIGTGAETGGNTPTYTKDFWEYNPEINTWTRKADFGGGVRSTAIGFSIGNKGYIGTGYVYVTQTNAVSKKDFWEYDPVTDTWTQKADAGTK